MPDQLYPYLVEIRDRYGIWPTMQHGVRARDRKHAHAEAQKAYRKKHGVPTSWDGLTSHVLSEPTPTPIPADTPAAAVG